MGLVEPSAWGRFEVSSVLCLFFVFVVVETRSLHVVLAGLRLAREIRLAPNSERSACFWLSVLGLKACVAMPS